METMDFIFTTTLLRTEFTRGTRIGHNSNSFVQICYSTVCPDKSGPQVSND